MRAALSCIGASALALSASVVSCANGQTGGALVQFHAYARGVDAASGSLTFDTENGFHVQLTSAFMRIGAVYMRLGQTNAGSANSSCVGDTTYGLQVPGGIEVDLLSSQLQEFSVLGDATSDLDQSGELWLTGGDINASIDATPIVQVAGLATKGSGVFPFLATITISSNRLLAPSNPAQPGQNPICKQRIIVPIPLQIQPSVGGDLALTIDPRPWFDSIDFGDLPVSTDDPNAYEIPDLSNGSGTGVTEGRTFFNSVTQASATQYRFDWITP
ncbi:MAG: hypothetical protein ACHREM_21810 [Polyangiales bacterium]